MVFEDLGVGEYVYFGEYFGDGGGLLLCECEFRVVGDVDEQYVFGGEEFVEFVVEFDVGQMCWGLGFGVDVGDDEVVV